MYPLTSQPIIQEGTISTLEKNVQNKQRECTKWKTTTIDNFRKAIEMEYMENMRKDDLKLQEEKLGKDEDKIH